MAFQVFDPRGFNTQTDYSGLTQGIGQLIQGQIANHFAKKAEEGDAGSMARLSSIDPRRAATLGSILDTRRQEQMYQEEQAAKQQAQQEQQKRELMGRIARGYTTAKDKVGYLSAAAANMDRAGYSDVADMIMVDLSKYKEAPGEVDQQYQAVQAMFGPGGEGNPAQVQYMQYLTQGFSPEQELQARQAAAGIAAKETTQKPIIIGGVPHVFDPNTGQFAPARVGDKPITATDVGADKGAIAEAEAEGKTRGAANAKTELAKPQKAKMMRESLRTLDRSLETADRALAQSGFMSTGVPGQLTSWIAGTPANKLRATLETLKSSLSMDEYKSLKEAGGGLGSATQAEWQMLAASVANLDPNQGDEQLRHSMGIIMKNYKDLRDKTERELSAIESPQESQQSPAQPAAPAKRMRFNPATGRLE